MRHFFKRFIEYIQAWRLVFLHLISHASLKRSKRLREEQMFIAYLKNRLEQTKAQPVVNNAPSKNPPFNEEYWTKRVKQDYYQVKEDLIAANPHIDIVGHLTKIHVMLAKIILNHPKYKSGNNADEALAEIKDKYHIAVISFMKLGHHYFENFKIPPERP